LEVDMHRDYAWTLLRALGITEGILKGTDETELPHEKKGIRHGQSYRIEPYRFANLPDGFKEQLTLDGFDLGSPITVTRSATPYTDCLRFTQ